MMVNNMEYWERILEPQMQNEYSMIIDEDFAEWSFWSRQVFHFESWWHNNPNSRVELIVYKPPARIGVAL